MTRPTWINLVCPACGCLPLEEPLEDAVRHNMHCAPPIGPNADTEEPDIFSEIAGALDEKHGRIAVAAAVAEQSLAGKLGDYPLVERALAKTNPVWKEAARYVLEYGGSFEEACNRIRYELALTEKGKAA